MLNKHFQDFLGLLEKHNVEYVIVGGYAVGVHGFPRYTGAMDVFVAISGENAGRLVEVFSEFGFASLSLKASDFLEPDTVVEVGREPMKIQVLTGIDGVTFDRCRSDRMMVNISGLQVPFIGFESLLANKAASPRSKDRIDLEELTRLRYLQKKREIEREIE
jgi:predicted nucleotidyltransferase